MKGLSNVLNVCKDYKNKHFYINEQHKKILLLKMMYSSSSSDRLIAKAKKSYTYQNVVLQAWIIESWRKTVQRVKTL